MLPVIACCDCGILAVCPLTELDEPLLFHELNEVLHLANPEVLHRGLVDFNAQSRPGGPHDGPARDRQRAFDEVGGKTKVRQAHAPIDSGYGAGKMDRCCRSDAACRTR